MRYEHDVMIDAARCIGCGLCEGDCPAAALAVEDVFLIAFIFRKSRDKSFGFHDDCFAS